MRVLRNYDVASYYPHLMTLYGYSSRNIPSPETFADVLDRRLKAKEEGDKHTSDTLKLVINTAYGASLTKYNDVYDPLMGRSVCVSGQLFLLDLTYGYLEACDTVKIIQTNTDGVLISVDDSELPKIHAVNAEWEARTGFMLEEDKVKKIVQKDVNNYVGIDISKEYCDIARKRVASYTVQQRLEFA
jgi:DNA polymerase elongation subunit (family B)